MTHKFLNYNATIFRQYKNKITILLTVSRELFLAWLSTLKNYSKYLNNYRNILHEHDEMTMCKKMTKKM